MTNGDGSPIALAGFGEAENAFFGLVVSATTQSRFSLGLKAMVLAGSLLLLELFA